MRMRRRSSTIHAFHVDYMMECWNEWITWTHCQSFLINRGCNMMSWSHLVQVLIKLWSIVFNHDYVVFTPYQRQTKIDGNRHASSLHWWRFCIIATFCIQSCFLVYTMLTIGHSMFARSFGENFVLYFTFTIRTHIALLNRDSVMLA